MGRGPASCTGRGVRSPSHFQRRGPRRSSFFSCLPPPPPVPRSPGFGKQGSESERAGLRRGAAAVEKGERGHRPHLCGARACPPRAAAARHAPPLRAWPGRAPAGPPMPPSLGRSVCAAAPRRLRGHRPSAGWGERMTSAPPRPPPPARVRAPGTAECGAGGRGHGAWPRLSLSILPFTGQEL